MQTRTYYQTLEIQENASQDTIRSAYKTLVLIAHPDKHPDDRKNATIKFMAIHEAYEVLSDSNQRADYDKTIKRDKKPSSDRFFSLNLSLEIEKLYKQFPDQLAHASFSNERSGYISIMLSGLSKASAESFKDQIRRIIGMSEQGWMCDSPGSYPDYRDSRIEFGYDKAQKSQYFMELIEKTVEKAFIDSMHSAEEFLRMSK